MAASKDIPGLRREGGALFIQRPRRGKQATQIPAEIVDSLAATLRDLAADSEELVVVPEDDLEQPRLFEKQHQATNYGRKLKDQLAEKDPAIGDHVAISTPPVDRTEAGKPVGPFLLALGRKPA